MPEQFDAGNNAILAKREAAYPVITSGAESSPTLVTLDDSRVLRMIRAIQHCFFKTSTVWHSDYGLFCLFLFEAPFCLGVCFG